jgi:hypothetical protein
MLADLEKKFDELMRQDCDECRRIRCPQAPFEQMLKRNGGAEACTRVIMLPDFPVPGGFKRLWERSLENPDVLKLTAEARVLEWPWCQLFHDRPDVLRRARSRLIKYERHDLTACPCLDC